MLAQRSARGLAAILESALAERPELTVAVDGGGEEWHVAVIAEHRSCRIHCPSAADYLVVYDEVGEPRFQGRASEPEMVAAAARDWLLATPSRRELCERYPF